MTELILPWGLVIPNAPIELQVEALLESISPGSGRRLYRRISQRVGEEPVGHLGMGRMGIAFALPSGRVLKFTRDFHEIDAAVVLMRERPHRNVVRFYDVFVVEGPPDKKGDPSDAVGVIVRDSVDEVVAYLDGFDRLVLALNHAVYAGHHTYMDSLLHYDGEDGEERAMRVGMLVFSASLAGIDGLSRKEARVRDDVLAGVHHLLSSGVYGVDFHAGNVGLVGSRGVLFDIGKTYAPETAPVERLSGLGFVDVVS